MVPDGAFLTIGGTRRRSISYATPSARGPRSLLREECGRAEEVEEEASKGLVLAVRHVRAELDSYAPDTAPPPPPASGHRRVRRPDAADGCSTRGGLATFHHDRDRRERRVVECPSGQELGDRFAHPDGVQGLDHPALGVGAAGQEDVRAAV